MQFRCTPTSILRMLWAASAASYQAMSCLPFNLSWRIISSSSLIRIGTSWPVQPWVPLRHACMPHFTLPNTKPTYINASAVTYYTGHDTLTTASESGIGIIPQTAAAPGVPSARLWTMASSSGKLISPLALLISLTLPCPSRMVESTTLCMRSLSTSTYTSLLPPPTPQEFLRGSSLELFSILYDLRATPMSGKNTCLTSMPDSLHGGTLQAS